MGVDQEKIYPEVISYCKLNEREIKNFYEGIEIERENYTHESAALFFLVKTNCIVIIRNVLP